MLNVKTPMAYSDKPPINWIKKDLFANLHPERDWPSSIASITGTSVLGFYTENLVQTG